MAEIDVSTLGAEQLSDLLRNVNARLDLLERLESTPKMVEELIREYHQLRGVEPGSPWVAPARPADVYMAGDIVSHGDQMWEADQDFVLYEPGGPGWVPHEAGDPQ